MSKLSISTLAAYKALSASTRINVYKFVKVDDGIFKIAPAFSPKHLPLHPNPELVSFIIEINAINK